MECRPIKKTKVRVFLVCTIVFGIFPFTLSADTVPDFLKPEKFSEPLSFQKIAVENVTKHQATIIWETNHPASGRVKYGDTRKLPGQQMIGYARSKHRVTLKGLTEGTKYGFRIFAWDGSEHRIKSQIVFFETAGTPPPQFERLWIKERTLEGGVLRWRTNIPTTARIRAGYDTPLMFGTEHRSPHKRHRVKFSQFHPDRDVLYEIMIEDTRGRTLSSGLRSFRTRENNVAYKKPVQGSFNKPPTGFNNPSYPVEKKGYNRRINDGSMLYFKGTATSGDPGDTEQWFEVDLKGLYHPDTAVFYWRDLAYPKQFHVEASVKGKNWIRLASDVNAESGENVPTSGGIDAYRNVVNLKDQTLPFRYVRVIIPKGAAYFGKFPSYRFVQLIEFKLFPRSLTGDPSPNLPTGSN